MNRTYTLGLVIPSIDNPFFAEISNGIIGEAKKYGYTVMAIDTLESELNEQEGIATLLDRKVDGLFIVPAGDDASYIERASRDNKTPVVLIDRHFENSPLPHVCSDNYNGARQAVQYLIDNGHSRIVCIQGVRHSMPNKQRTAGYADTMRDNSLAQYVKTVGDDFSIENGYRRTLDALCSEQRPTAVFTLSNTIALGAIKAIRDAGMSIPDDISLISFDDNPYLDFLSPAITRIGQPTGEICRQAMFIMSSEVRHGDLSSEIRPDSEALPTTLIIRDSVADIKGR